MVSIQAVKQKLSKGLFDLFDVRRVHIVGCSRSGTTMMHLAFICFENCYLADKESSISYPFLADRLRLVGHMSRQRRSTKVYVTKRDFGWWRHESVKHLLDGLQNDSIGLIHLVRDPMDIFASRHSRSKDEERGVGYVTPDHWLNSIEAWERIEANLPRHTPFLQLRYEDVILTPDVVGKSIMSKFDLRMHPKALGIDKIGQNVERMSLTVSEEFRGAVGDIRDMDLRSIGRGRAAGAGLAELGSSREFVDRVCRFCERYGYDRPVV